MRLNFIAPYDILAIGGVIMKLKSVTVGGFKNLKKTRLSLDSITAIVSPNNYGKSNLLEAIDFGVDFLSSNSKERKSMMRWVRGIPINKSLENDEYFFEIEFEDDKLGEYRFVRYGYKFTWFRDDGLGQKITDEWIETRSTESVRYTAFLKRPEGKYRKEKATNSFRKIVLDDGQLSIDVLLSIDDIAIHPVISAIKNISYHICSSLDLGDRFQATPIEYIDQNDDEAISFDDKDVPRALHQLKQYDPEKYELFLEAVLSLFPEFLDISVQSYEIKKEISKINMFVAETDGESLSAVPKDSLNSEEKIPFRIKDEIYRLLIDSKYLNQPINMAMMSTGTKRVFWLLANVFIASAKGMSFIGVEELETSIHPKLLKNLLEILDEALIDTSLIISSHSPFLVQYIKPEKIYVGIPTVDGTAQFQKVQTNRVKNLINAARSMGMSVGEYLFELMSGDQDSAEMLSFYLEGQS